MKLAKRNPRCNAASIAPLAQVPAWRKMTTRARVRIVCSTVSTAGRLGPHVHEVQAQERGDGQQAERPGAVESVAQVVVVAVLGVAARAFSRRRRTVAASRSAMNSGS